MTHEQLNKTSKSNSKAVTYMAGKEQENDANSFQFEDNRPEAIAQRKMQHIMASHSPQHTIVQKQKNNTGLPDDLKSGIENLSGYAMDDVKVHYNSDKPAQLQAHAYAQGTNIHVAPGQEKHLPHEAWHVVQQKQGRVKPTLQLKEKVNVNNDAQLEKEADVMGAKALQNKNSTTANSLMATTSNSQTIQGAFKYAAAVTLDRAGKLQDTRTQNLQIDSIALPEAFRPPTQYGDGQQSHSVSWTLLKRGYTSVHNLPMNTFIDNYLIHDWNSLRQQITHMNTGSATKTAAYQQLNQYLNVYTQAHFETLKANQEAPLTIQNEIRKAVSDYFIAIQLAPLSTHSGRILNLDGTQIPNAKSYKPVSNGEPAANEKLTEIEATLTAASVANDDQRDKVIEKARAYWDPGTGKQGGINDPTAVTLIAEKLHTSLARSFPQIWRLYGANITAAITQPEINNATTIIGIGNYPNEANNPAAPKVTGTTAVKPVKFHAHIQTSDIRLALNQPAPVQASDLTITSVHLPDDRPPTKYGSSGQKSHTVAWTLTLKAITKAASGKNLRTFLQYMLHRWQLLNGQDWDRAIGQVLDNSSQFSNATNSARLTTLRGKIAPAIGRLNTAINAGPKSDLQWTKLIQDNLSEYFEVSASAPLTTYKDGVPGGHGEADANEHLSNLEANVAGHANSPEWSGKFQTEFVTDNGNSWKEPHFQDDLDEMKRIHNLVSGNTALSPAETTKRNQILVRQLALKYLDIKWNAFMIPGSGAIDSAETDMAAVLREWETSFKEAFPNTWLQYRGIIMEVANTYALSHSIATRNHPRKTMSHWMEPMHGEDGLKDVRAGDMTQNGSTAYNTAKADYGNGLAARRAGNANRGNSTAHDAAKDDYDAGVRQAQLNPTAPLPANMHHGFNEGYNDYINGLHLAEQQPQTVLPGGHHAGWNEGYNNYRDGYNAALLNPMINLPGGHSVAWNRGYTEYQAGYRGALANPGTLLPNGHSVAFNNGWTHYYNGYMNGYNNNVALAAHVAIGAYDAGHYRGERARLDELAKPTKKVKI